MSISGLSSIWMINVNYISISTTPSGFGNCTTAGSIYRSSLRNCPVNTLMLCACTLRRTLTGSDSRRHSSAVKRFNICRRNLGSGHYTLCNRLIYNILCKNQYRCILTTNLLFFDRKDFLVMFFQVLLNMHLMQKGINAFSQKFLQASYTKTQKNHLLKTCRTSLTMGNPT